MTYNELKIKVLEKYFSRTNPMQRQAIFTINGAVLIIAGAGSGKTTVLCNRIANMILFGNAYNKNSVRELSDSDREFAESYLNGEIENFAAAGRLSEIFGEDTVKPRRILAVTFTNKAAAELKERLSNMGADVEGIWAATFHSACVKILRRDIESLGLGYKSNFTIYDMDDALKVIKNIMKDNNLSEKTFTPKSIQGIISRAKDKLITPDKFSAMGKNGNEDFLLATAKTVYKEYQQRLINANALDFDDIINVTVRLFANCPDVLHSWQERFKYIMVDEYQDTNVAQYKLISLLAGDNGNLCVVGDEDQSIYRFRGATIENILSFEDEFDAEVIKLEQNYRSTSTILEAANAVIRNNTQHKDKNLWSNMGEGDKIRLDRFSSEQEEGMFVTERILDGIKAGKQYSDHVVLYRNNAQSRTVETSLAKAGIPYKIIGGVRFFERKEIKDIIAYLSVLNNNFDEVRFSRIINEPLRGIGDATQQEIINVANGMGMSLVDVLIESPNFPSLSKKAKTLQPIGEIFMELSREVDDISDGSIIDKILEMFGYREAMVKQGIEGEVRLENIAELKSSMMTYAKENEGATLSDFLENVALVSDMDNFEASEDKVVLMTMHSAKGLEFDTVFVVGAEENIFPGYRSQFDPMEVEEERRLAYVAITRAKRTLYFTCAKQRMLYGQTMRNKVSRFVSEIPPKYMQYNDTTALTASAKSPAPAPQKREGYLKSNGYTRPSAFSASSSIGGGKTSSGGAPSESYNAGDRVKHNVFGEGTVLSAKPMGGDMLLEIAFDTQGTKKLAAKFAKLKKI
ncbi:MAG: superfamily I DNA and RNA helicase [Ruminococcaceae bacterium]|nr:superfamily I DNA and RNA helicase [Oscillospiraceae bacterium]